MQTVAVTCPQDSGIFNGTTDNYQGADDSFDFYFCYLHHIQAKVPHNYATNYKYDGDFHWQECQNPGCTEQRNRESHKGGTATCTVKAVCEVCNQPYGDLKAHTLVKVEKKDATCTEEGYEAYWSCEECGKLFEDEAGKITLSVPKTIPTADHNFSILQYDETEHWYKYSGCDGTDGKEEHSGGTATCTTQAVCDICKQPYGDVNLQNHINLVYTFEKPATLTEEGNTEYWYCNDCKKYFSDENAENEITKEETVLAKLTPTITEDDKEEVPTPTVVPTTTPAASQAKTNEVTPSAAKTSSTTINTIAEENTAAAPKTDDRSAAELYIILLLVSLGVLGTLSAGIKKNIKH